MSTHVPGDQAQRRQALDVGRSFIVQAPAGSGKTELLTQRYLRLLAVVEHPEEISAITFTRKAAGEMRQRILTALDEASGDVPAEAHRRLTWQLARDALAQDTRRQWGITVNPNRLRIQTFDSLSHSLARQMPLLSELGAPPATTERPMPCYREAAHATLRMLEDPTLGDDIEHLLRHLDNRQGQLAGLLCSLLARREQWLPHVLAAPDGERLDEALGDAVAAHLEQLHAHCAIDWLTALLAVARESTGNRPGAGGAPDFQVPPGTGWPDLPVWQSLAELLLTTTGSPRRRWTADNGFPPPGERGIDAATRARRKLAKETIEQLVATLATEPEALSLWAGLRLLPRQGLDAGQHRLLASLFRVLLHAAAELQLVFRQRGEVDFAEIQIRAQRALGDPGEPTDLALSLDYRLRHLLVDEFQDTSSGQYRLLETLTAGWQDGDGRTLFAVGDPMQSIYRFREAEVGLYLDARERGIGQLPLVPLTLEVNFRSTRAVVDWVNAGFGRIFPQRVDVGRGAVPYSPASAFDATPDDDAVRVHAFAGRDDRAEAETVAELVDQALAEPDGGSIAVLARARSHLHGIALALQARGVAFQAVDIDPLAQRPTVRDLHALTRALLHPADRLSWLVVLRAPWLGLVLSDLLAIAESSPRCIPARLRDSEVLATLSDDGRRRVDRLTRLLDRQLPARGRRPLREWVEGIWLALGGAAVAGQRGIVDAQAYLALLERHATAAGLTDFATLEEALAELYARPDSLSDGRVQLMTMHKAKGLEFDTVILPGLGRRARGDSSELLYWLERPGPRGGPQLLMAPIRASDQPAEPISDYLREMDRDKQRLETARLLYVAVTRARRRLHLLGHLAVTRRGLAEQPATGSLLEKLWPAVEDRFAGLQAPATGLTDAPASPPPPLWRLPVDWQAAAPADRHPGAVADEPEATPARIEFAWAGDTARHVGTLVHRHLERFASEGLARWPVRRLSTLAPTLRGGLRHLGVEDDELDAATDKALRALRQTLEDDTGRWILGAHREARSEWALTLHEAHSRHFVIDRTFVDDADTRWIVDYKTGEHLEGDRDTFLDQEVERYRAQLETYGRILRLLETRPIRLALYFPLFPALRTWDYEG